MKDLLLITPPFTQLNTPYPATAYLKGFLNTRGISASQMDLGIETILALFSPETLASVFEIAEEDGRIDTPNSQRIFALRDRYVRTIEPVIQFLQGHNPALARQICSDAFLPRASRFDQLADLEWTFGTMGMQDRAKHLATLYLEDLSDFIVECLDEHFGFSRYAERLGRSANSFDELYQHLQAPFTLVDEIYLQLLTEMIEETQPRLVCFSVPFPGNLYSAFRCAQLIQAEYPEIAVAMGGGFANTELRSVSDPRVFEFFDFITLDDGERPIELLHQAVCLPEQAEAPTFKRTFLLVDGAVVYRNDASQPDYKQEEIGTPDYSDLPLDDYISVIEVANPMHSLWSDGRWLKLTMAHGCYWGKCTFCDISLDYIRLYEPIAAKTLVDRMEQMMEATGETGFHFVDEAAPPALMKAVALEILRRKLVVTWWTNIRFEKNFTWELCQLLAESGCIAVSGGLEVASDRLLALIDKGVTVEQVARVTRNFTESGIMVHSYLMYGYPTQTVQETVDSLEMVRQMFELGIIQSGFWHQFALTAHSPVGLNPDAYGVLPNYQPITFANNDVDFVDSTGIDHGQFSFGLKKSLYNYMNGIGFDFPLGEWFDFPIPGTQIAPDVIARSLEEIPFVTPKSTSRMVWLGTQPLVETYATTPSRNAPQFMELTFHTKREAFQITVDAELGDWLTDMLELMSPQADRSMTFGKFRKAFEEEFEDFAHFWHSPEIEQLRANGLLVL
ncbi:radical SAM protein [Pontibacter sp. G13]|uniref:B12-binding domain-containing radical SAM protein n=1 Tax=Pontibacter sp. G13 TaxID=3074898 RepID=UPI00288B35D8|nr:radical SAM protein [Pontibacter sp. G13]WNJ17452.1 radical SAM protein [Pontibacter sp. G13]